MIRVTLAAIPTTLSKTLLSQLGTTNHRLSKVAIYTCIPVIGEASFWYFSATKPLIKT
jgi:hypothetical protein